VLMYIIVEEEEMVLEKERHGHKTGNTLERGIKMYISHCQNAKQVQKETF